MSSSDWAWVIFAALAVVIWASVELGRQAERGRLEQEHGDQAEELAHMRARVRELEQRDEAKSARIRAQTDWVVISGDSALPGLLRAVPMQRAAPTADVGRIDGCADRRALEDAGPVAPVEVGAVAAVGEPIQDEPAGFLSSSRGILEPDATSWDGWPPIFAMCASGREWVGTL